MEYPVDSPADRPAGSMPVQSSIGTFIRVVKFYLSRKAPATMRKGEAIQIVHKGNVIKCLPDVEHWHGATRESGFAYLAVTPSQKGKTIWLEPVSDKDYNSLK
jgi:hypothetical protein